MSWMLRCETEYGFSVLALTAPVLFQLRQQYLRGSQLVQQEFRPRQGPGNRLIEHLSVVPDAKRVL
jgi:hypothetical protein